ncbi:MAG: rhodanese-like domain-containing protein [Gemmatimonadetes bacterium]|nr:rhodanese-like domain-containing protein [Gemmatimonadota bacterium]
MSVDQVMPDEAARLVESEGYVYIDVRSVPEFDQGHPAPAVNIPLLHADEQSGQMTPNPDFVQVVKANYPEDAKLVLGCRTGQRSDHAAQLLQSMGYQTVVNMRCGFSGEMTPFGQVVNPGWEEVGLPVSHDSGEGVSYASLAGKPEGS